MNFFKNLVFCINILILNLNSVTANQNSIDNPNAITIPEPQVDEEFFKEEFKTLFVLQNSRTVEECELAAEQSMPLFKNLYLNKRSPRIKKFELKEKTLLKALMSSALIYAESYSTNFKEKYKRLRPYVMSSQVKPCISKPQGSYSYPSYHAVAGAITSCLLMDIYPEYSNAFRDYGIKIGYLRNIGGVHFPSDVKVGYKLGIDLCHKYIQDSVYKKLFSKIKKEISK